MVKYTDNVPLLNFIHSNTESIAANVVIKRIAIFLNGAVYKHAISLNGYFTIKILISSSCAFVSFIMCPCFWFSSCLRPVPSLVCYRLNSTVLCLWLFCLLMSSASLFYATVSCPVPLSSEPWFPVSRLL